MIKKIKENPLAYVLPGFILALYVGMLMFGVIATDKRREAEAVLFDPLTYENYEPFQEVVWVKLTNITESENGYDVTFVGDDKTYVVSDYKYYGICEHYLGRRMQIRLFGQWIDNHRVYYDWNMIHMDWNLKELLTF